MVRVDRRGRAAAERQLELYELLVAAMDRRDEVFDIVDSSEDENEAQERIRALFEVRDPHISRAVLDMQVSRWTRADRRRIADDAAHLRRLLDVMPSQVVQPGDG